MSEFKAGQRVKVEFEGTVDQNSSSTSLWVRRDDTTLNVVSTSTCKVTLAGPKDWPPQAGDVWEADGKLYHAQQGNGGILFREVVSPEALEPLNPVLVRRTGQ